MSQLCSSYSERARDCILFTTIPTSFPCMQQWLLDVNVENIWNICILISICHHFYHFYQHEHLALLLWVDMMATIKRSLNKYAGHFYCFISKKSHTDSAAHSVSLQIYILLYSLSNGIMMDQRHRPESLFSLIILFLLYNISRKQRI